MREYIFDQISTGLAKCLLCIPSTSLASSLGIVYFFEITRSFLTKFLHTDQRFSRRFYSPILDIINP